MSGPPLTFRCPICQGDETIWIGYRNNKSGRKRVRRCKNCQAKFTPSNAFPRARFDKVHLIEAAGLFHGGMSLSEIRNHMKLHRGVDVSRTSILNWARKYSKTVSDFSTRLKHVIRGVGNCDDVYLEVSGNELNYWGAMDSVVMFRIDSRLA
jgi:transposase-like protein